jgi:diguanylate cyclase (GGDEF)-like protein
VSSAYTEPDPDPDGRGSVRSGLGVLRGAGMATVVALPVRLLGSEVGLILVGDAAPMRIDTDRVEALELLSDAVARGLDLSGLVTELRERAMRDPMTGLQNQRAFAEAMGSFGGRRVHRWTLMMADIDGFKDVNDTLGHRTGDRVLADLAAALDEILRPLDRIFRVGGDEFALIMPDLDEPTAAEIGGRLCDAAASVLGEFGASLSVGIALPVDGEEAEDFIDRADRTLYEAKRRRPGTARLSRS